MIMRALGLFSAAVVLGCGSGGGGDASNRLRIEMRPVTAIAWSGVFEADPELGVRASEVVTFAWGGDYPRALEISMDEEWATCGSLDGTFTLDEVESQDEALEVELTGPASFRLAPTAEGEFDAIVRGTFVANPDVASCAGASVPIELHVSVPVRRPVGVLIAPPSECSESVAFRVETGGRLAPDLYLQLVDADGTAFQPRNAVSTHPATLDVVTGEDAELSLHTPDDGFAALVVAGEPGPVSVVAFDEEQQVIEHVAPADIDVVGVRFSLLGFAGNPTPLESGGTYGESGWARTTSSIGISSSGLTVDGERICTMPRADGFVLESSTPQTCTTYAELGHGVGPLGESVFDLAVPLSAEVMASGTCVLQLDGPDYSGGDGFSAELSVDIMNAESLAHTDGR
jgi:hypothetical protein